MSATGLCRAGSSEELTGIDIRALKHSNALRTMPIGIRERVAPTIVSNRFHAAEAEVVCAGADFALAARANHVARAELIGAEKRPAAMHPFLHARFSGIERVGRTLRVARDAADRRQLTVVVRAIPIADPLPDVADDVMEPDAFAGNRATRAIPGK